MNDSQITFTVKTIVDQLKSCDLETLTTIKPILIDMIQDIESSINQANAPLEQNRRTEDRFTTELSGTLSRLSDVRPGEKKEFDIKIKDLSRKGMQIMISADYNHSRVNRVTFASLNGQVKKIYLQVMRNQKMFDDHEEWLILGTRVITEEQVQYVRRQEKKVQKVINKLHQKKIKLLLIGKSTSQSETLGILLNKEKYPYQEVDSVDQALELINQESYDLLLFTEWSKIYQDSSLFKQINAQTQKLAKVALNQPEYSQSDFLKSGIDACLPEFVNQKVLDQTLERALSHKSENEDLSGEFQSRYNTVLFSDDNEIIQWFSHLFKKHQFSEQAISHIDQITPKVLENLDLFFLLYNTEDIDSFRIACLRSTQAPSIAICQSKEDGHQALTNGAEDFITLPPKEEDFQLLLDKWLPASAETSSPNS